MADFFKQENDKLSKVQTEVWTEKEGYAQKQKSYENLIEQLQRQISIKEQESGVYAQKMALMKENTKQLRSKLSSNFQEGGLTFSKDKEIEFLKFTNKKLERQANCSSCSERAKEYVLPCGHLFCKGCIDKEFETRRRACPIDRQKFTQNQARRIFLDDVQGDSMDMDE